MHYRQIIFWADLVQTPKKSHIGIWTHIRLERFRNQCANYCRLYFVPKSLSDSLAEHRRTFRIHGIQLHLSWLKSGRNQCLGTTMLATDFSRRGTRVTTTLSAKI